MAGGIFAKELEEELMKFTMKSGDQSDKTTLKIADMDLSSKLAKENSGKTFLEAQVRGKSTIAPINVNNNELKAKIDTSASRESASVVREHEDKVMKFTANSSNLGEQINEVPKNTDEDIDIIGGAKMLGHRVVESEPLQMTECSSSFDATEDSGDEVSDLFGDSEASSSLRGDFEPSQIQFNGFGELSRMSLKKRKVSSQWRSYIQPLTWRLKWAELQMKMLNLFAQGYDRKLEDCNKLKQIRLEKPESEGVCAKQIPYTHVNNANHILRRKKRNRTESAGDLAKYMSNHNLFSYYNNRRKNVPTAQLPISEKAAPKFINDDEPWASEESLLLKFQQDDSSSDDALRKIFNLESKIISMKSKVNKILHENAGMYLDANCQNNGDASSIGTYITAQLMSEYSLSDDLAPEDEATVPENMVPGLRNKAHHHNGGQVVKEERNTIKEVQRPLVIRDISVNPNSSTQMEDDSNVDDQSPKKIRSVATLTGPRSKRNGGGKKKAVANRRGSK